MIKIPVANQPVIAAGVRTPFVESADAFDKLMSYELGAKVLAALVERADIDPELLQMVVMGTVVHEVNTTNVARDAMFAAGLPDRVPAYTVAMAGISPNVGVANVCDMIALGRIDMGIAGGTESFSDVPLRLSQGLRRSLMKVRQSRTTQDRLKALSGLRPRDLMIDAPMNADFSTKQGMGESTEIMVKRFGMTREQSDEFAVNSHARAVAAIESGFYQPQIVPVQNGNRRVTTDNTPRRDATLAKLQKLPPVFDKQHGIVTAGNSSRFTDGAGALLLTSQAAAKKSGLPVLATIRDYFLTGVRDMRTEMLLGPAVSIPVLLQRNGLTFDDVAVWEIHEAFASQILINRQCLMSREFVTERFGKDYPHGEIPLSTLNTKGGSLALGNPFAATGIRLMQTAAQRLQQDGGRYAVVATCAGGGLGAAFLLEA